MIDYWSIVLILCVRSGRVRINMQHVVGYVNKGEICLKK